MIFEYPIQIYFSDSIRNALFTGIIQIKNNRIVMRINVEKPVKELNAQALIDATPQRWKR